MRFVWVDYSDLCDHPLLPVAAHSIAIYIVLAQAACMFFSWVCSSESWHSLSLWPASSSLPTRCVGRFIPSPSPVRRPPVGVIPQPRDVVNGAQGFVLVSHAVLHRVRRCRGLTGPLVSLMSVYVRRQGGLRTCICASHRAAVPSARQALALNSPLLVLHIIRDSTRPASRCQCMRAARS